MGKRKTTRAPREPLIRDLVITNTFEVDYAPIGESLEAVTFQRFPKAFWVPPEEIARLFEMANIRRWADTVAAMLRDFVRDGDKIPYAVWRPTSNGGRGRPGSTPYLNLESGFVIWLMRSAKPCAVAFQSWIFNTALPTLQGKLRALPPPRPDFDGLYDGIDRLARRNREYEQRIARLESLLHRSLLGWDGAKSHAGAILASGRKDHALARQAVRDRDQFLFTVMDVSLADLRVEVGFESIRAASEAAQVSASAWGRIESGHTIQPQVGTVRRIAAALELSATALSERMGWTRAYRRLKKTAVLNLKEHQA